MKTSINTVSVPCAYITKNKQRTKQHNDTVYLNNGDEFELELYNPTLNKVLVKIELNGNSIGSGVVIKPGQRVFLERYINDNKKFLFETYEVEGNNNQVKNAIQKNGDVSVYFYSEQIPTSYWTNNWNFNYPITSTLTSVYTSQPTIGGISANLFNTSATYSTSTTSFGNATPTSGERRISLDKPENESKIETGRIEKGSNSNQTFGYDNSNFYSYHSWISRWKILPSSQKAITKEDLVVFCTECGAKRKKDSHKFCPHCGIKF
jgi:hypothetical protein